MMVLFWWSSSNVCVGVYLRGVYIEGEEEELSMMLLCQLYQLWFFRR
jgi:hypothetical protein